MNTEILMPIFYMMLLTFSIAMLQTAVRFKAVNNGEHTPEEMFAIPLPLDSNDLVKRTDRNLTNLFEFPILFYAACITCYVTGLTDNQFINLGYAYVGLRFIHSAYHIGSNANQNLRGLVWLSSTGIILWMWVRLAMMF
jgi:hypothetical protein